MATLRSLIAETRYVVEADASPYPALLSVLTSLQTGDTVEITYADKQKGGGTTAKRVVTMSWQDYKDQASRSSDPGQAFHFKFKASPSVLLGPSSANKAHLNKPGKGGGLLKDYGDSIQFQATMSTPIKQVLALKKL